jgi:hypothetical protein
LPNVQTVNPLNQSIKLFAPDWVLRLIKESVWVGHCLVHLKLSQLEDGSMKVDLNLMFELDIRELRDTTVEDVVCVALIG